MNYVHEPAWRSLKIEEILLSVLNQHHAGETIESPPPFGFSASLLLDDGAAADGNAWHGSERVSNRLDLLGLLLFVLSQRRPLLFLLMMFSRIGRHNWNKRRIPKGLAHSQMVDRSW